MTQLVVSLDVPTPGAAVAVVAALGDRVTHYKVGSAISLRPWFPALVRALKLRGKHVMLDTKVRDIPATVAAHARAAADAGIDAMTVNADRDSLWAVRQAVPSMTVFAVGELTSKGPSRSSINGVTADLAREHGCSVVVDPRRLTPHSRRHLWMATPGVRLGGGDADDHARPISPSEAVLLGSSWIIVGRPIVSAPDPLAAAELFLREIGR